MLAQPCILVFEERATEDEDFMYVDAGIAVIAEGKCGKPDARIGSWNGTFITNPQNLSETVYPDNETAITTYFLGTVVEGEVGVFYSMCWGAGPARTPRDLRFPYPIFRDF